MEQRFRGTSTHKVDPKGRVSIPSSFRQVLDACDPHREPGSNPRVHVLYGDTRSPWFTCYSVAAMRDIDAQIDAMPDGDPNREALEDYFYTYVETLTLDDSGRLILNAGLRERIGLTDSAVFASKGRTFRILSPDVPEGAASRLQSTLADLPEGMPVASLLRAGRPAEP